MQMQIAMQLKFADRACSTSRMPTGSSSPCDAIMMACPRAHLLRAGVKYGSANVLVDDGVRDGIKKFSGWPTIPQVSGLLLLLLLLAVHDRSCCLLAQQPSSSAAPHPSYLEPGTLYGFICGHSVLSWARACECDPCHARARTHARTQVYVDGEFIGGSDILLKMHESGDLDKLLEPIKKGTPTRK